MLRKNVFVNTSELVKTLNEIGERSHLRDWRKDDGDKLLNLQEEIKKEREFLKSFWNEEGYIPMPGLAGWKWWLALYDLPLDYQTYALNRGDGKYGIFHTREDWLEELQHHIFCLFHSWHFDTEGWTAF